jgi:AbrB family looped-hinge helix DNA binding protein
METTIDRAGRLVIPKAVRDSAGLRPGQPLRVECRDGKVEIEALCAEARVRRRGSHFTLTVPAGTSALSVETVRRTLEAIREERSRKAMGRAR